MTPIASLSPLSPKRLSRALRTGTSDALKRRRSVLALSLTAAGSMGLIALWSVEKLGDGGLDAKHDEAVHVVDEASEERLRSLHRLTPP